MAKGQTPVTFSDDNRAFLERKAALENRSLSSLVDLIVTRYRGAVNAGENFIGLVCAIHPDPETRPATMELLVRHHAHEIGTVTEEQKAAIVAQAEIAIGRRQPEKVCCTKCNGSTLVNDEVCMACDGTGLVDPE